MNLGTNGLSVLPSATNLSSTYMHARLFVVAREEQEETVKPRHRGQSRSLRVRNMRLHNTYGHSIMCTAAACGLTVSNAVLQQESVLSYAQVRPAAIGC